MSRKGYLKYVEDEVSNLRLVVVIDVGNSRTKAAFGTFKSQNPMEGIYSVAFEHTGGFMRNGWNILDCDDSGTLSMEFGQSMVNRENNCGLSIKRHLINHSLGIKCAKSSCSYPLFVEGNELYTQFTTTEKSRSSRRNVYLTDILKNLLKDIVLKVIDYTRTTLPKLAVPGLFKSGYSKNKAIDGTRIERVFFGIMVPNDCGSAYKESILLHCKEIGLKHFTLLTESNAVMGKLISGKDNENKTELCMNIDNGSFSLNLSCYIKHNGIVEEITSTSHHNLGGRDDDYLLLESFVGDLNKHLETVGVKNYRTNLLCVEDFREAICTKMSEFYEEDSESFVIFCTQFVAQNIPVNSDTCSRSDIIDMFGWARKISLFLSPGLQQTVFERSLCEVVKTLLINTRKRYWYIAKFVYKDMMAKKLDLNLNLRSLLNDMSLSLTGGNAWNVLLYAVLCGMAIFPNLPILKCGKIRRVTLLESSARNGVALLRQMIRGGKTDPEGHRRKFRVLRPVWAISINRGDFSIIPGSNTAFYDERANTIKLLGPFEMPQSGSSSFRLTACKGKFLGQRMEHTEKWKRLSGLATHEVHFSYDHLLPHNEREDNRQDNPIGLAFVRKRVFSKLKNVIEMTKKNKFFVAVVQCPRTNWLFLEIITFRHSIGFRTTTALSSNEVQGNNFTSNLWATSQIKVDPLDDCAEEGFEVMDATRANNNTRPSHLEGTSIQENAKPEVVKEMREREMNEHSKLVDYDDIAKVSPISEKVGTRKRSFNDILRSKMNREPYDIAKVSPISENVKKSFNDILRSKRNRESYDFDEVKKRKMKKRKVEKPKKKRRRRKMKLRFSKQKKKKKKDKEFFLNKCKDIKYQKFVGLEE